MATHRICVFEGKGLNPSKYFYTTFPVAKHRHFVSFAEEPNWEKQIETYGSVGAQLRRELMSIPGISYVSVSRNEIHVSKLAAYSWKEVYPQVCQKLRGIFYDLHPQIKEENPIALSIKRTLTAIRSIV